MNTLNKIEIGNTEIDLVSYDTETTKSRYIQSFESLNNDENLRFNYNVFNIDGFRLEITGSVERRFIVEVFEPDGNLYHKAILSTNMWIQLSRKYFVHW